MWVGYRKEVIQLHIWLFVFKVGFRKKNVVFLDVLYYLAQCSLENLNSSLKNISILQGNTNVIWLRFTFKLVVLGQKIFFTDIKYFISEKSQRSLTDKLSSIWLPK